MSKPVGGKRPAVGGSGSSADAANSLPPTAYRLPLVSVRGLGKNYRDGFNTIKVIAGLDFELSAGQTAAIVGRSGSGKTTLLNILGLLDRPSSGEMLFDGRPVAGLGESARGDLRARSLGFVFQAYHLVAELSALENVLLAARVAAGAGWFFSAAAARRKARELLERVGISGRMRGRPAKLSGGEKQRVAIARALVNGPRLLLADEPTGNLDAATAREVEELLFGLVAERNLAMVLVTHEPALAARCGRVLELENGRLKSKS